MHRGRGWRVPGLSGAHAAQPGSSGVQMPERLTGGRSGGRSRTPLTCALLGASASLSEHPLCSGCLWTRTWRCRCSGGTWRFQEIDEGIGDQGLLPAPRRPRPAGQASSWTLGCLRRPSLELDKVSATLRNKGYK